MRSPKVSRATTKQIAAANKVVNGHERTTTSVSPADLLDGPAMPDNSSARTSKNLSPLGLRLQRVANKFEWSFSELGRKVGVPARGHMLKIAESGNLTANVLIKIWKVTGINLHWLLTGEGSMGLTLRRDDDDAASVQRRTSPPPPRPRPRDSRKTK